MTGGYTPSSGVLQVYDGISKWGFVCGEIRFDLRRQIADVVCRSLGYAWALSFFTDEPRDENFIRRLHCGIGTHDIEQCMLEGWRRSYDNRHNCEKSAGIVCAEGMFTITYLLCSELGKVVIVIMLFPGVIYGLYSCLIFTT